MQILFLFLKASQSGFFLENSLSLTPLNDVVDVMAFQWKKAFSRSSLPWKGAESFTDVVNLKTLPQLKDFLDQVHIKHCLLRPFIETKDYPVVEPRDLIPSFEPDTYEYHHLPGFSMVALARTMHSFEEVFQYDVLYPALDAVSNAEGAASPLESQVINRNAQTFLSRLPRKLQDSFREQLEHVDISILDYYPALMRYLPEMDRAHVFAQDMFGFFHLAGVYASFPSDADGEIKRFGLRTGKFRLGDNNLYERNRLFVYQYLMELYGFPVASERRTSAAMFARKLQQMGESFLVRVLGQSDRTLTTIWYEPSIHSSAQIEKIALIRIDADQHDLLQQLEEEGYLVDVAQRVAIARIIYRQHRFSADNVRQDRALSVTEQQLIHPMTGHVLRGINVIRDSTTLILRLNDITRGEFSGRVVYKRNEIVENTDTHEKRLKCLFSWLSRHQRRIIGYSDEFYANVTRVLDGYLLNPDYQEDFDAIKELHQEVQAKYAFIRQARQVRFFEDLRARTFKGERIGYARMLREAVPMLQDFKFDQSNYFAPLTESLIVQCRAMVNDRYLRKNYVEPPEEKLSPAGLEIRRNYGRLVAVYDDLVAISRARSSFGG